MAFRKRAHVACPQEEQENSMTPPSSEDLLIDEVRVLVRSILMNIHGTRTAPQIVREAQLLEAQLRATRSDDLRRAAFGRLAKLKCDLERLRAAGR